MFDPVSVRFTGPLAPYAIGFFEDLVRRGYSPLSAGNLLRVAAHLSRWLRSQRLEAPALSADVAARFAKRRRRMRYTAFRSARALHPLLDYLRNLGVVVDVAPSLRRDRVSVLVHDYAVYLGKERGLAPGTVRAYTDFARRFILEARPCLDWHRLTADVVVAFITRDAQRLSKGYCKHSVTGLRSLLRFLRARGHIRLDLDGCVPAVASWRLSGIPKHLQPEDVVRIWRACKGSDAVSRRDAAIIRLLLRLGLRAGEVTALRLDDIDWRRGELMVRGKARREARMPLPADVGRAIASYLRVRPRSADRRIFLRARAPFTALDSSAVVGATRRVLRLAGVVGSAHSLRHTAATLMLRGGASLPEVGHALRHRALSSTVIYAKVDFHSLRTVVQRWPGGVS